MKVHDYSTVCPFQWKRKLIHRIDKAVYGACESQRGDVSRGLHIRRDGFTNLLYTNQHELFFQLNELDNGSGRDLS